MNDSIKLAKSVRLVTCEVGIDELENPFCGISSGREREPQGLEMSGDTGSRTSVTDVTFG
jgi:hypothetical protein